jgi:hypothetical protein
VKIETDGDAVNIQVQGMHKMLALESSLRVPLADGWDVRHDPERATRFMPGARIRAPRSRTSTRRDLITRLPDRLRPEF